MNPSTLRRRQFQRILLIKPSAVGDVIHSLPILAKLLNVDAGRLMLTLYDALADGTPGALVGKCRVVVNWPPRERDDSKPAPKEPSPSIPIKYTVAKDTPLEFEVKEGSNKIDLPLIK